MLVFLPMQPKILSTMKGYRLLDCRDDLLAGITVALVAVPLSIALAIASGARPEAGLITAIIAGFLISLLGGSKVQIGGPTGAFIVVVFSTIAEHGYDGLLLATMTAGMMLIIAGVLRAGHIMRFVPHSVINGFTLGIAVIIASSQFNDFLGLQVTFTSASFFDKIENLWMARGNFHGPSLVTGLLTIGLIVLLRKRFPRFPGLIFILGAMSYLVALADRDIATVFSQYGALPDSLPSPTVPEISMARLTAIFPSAIIIAFLAGIESLLSASVADRHIGDTHRSNAELIAQGVANLGSSLFGGLPATGAIARTATNIQAGGKTPVAGMIHAVVILLGLIWAAPLAGYLAMPALAGLLIMVAVNMSEPGKWSSYLLEGTLLDRAVLWLTFILTVFADLTVAIAVGVAVSAGANAIMSSMPGPGKDK